MKPQRIIYKVQFLQKNYYKVKNLSLQIYFSPQISFNNENQRLEAHKLKPQGFILLKTIFYT